MKKRFLLLFYFLGAIGLAHAQKTARIYLNGYGGGTSTGTVKVRVYNASYDSTFVLDVSNETTNRSYLSPPMGMYNISVENLSNGQVYHNICQMGNVCNSDYLRQNMCGYASDNTGIYDSQIGTNMGSTKIVYQNLNIVSKLNYQNKCITRFSDLDGDYELGAIYITLIVDERNVCRTMNYVRPFVTTNAQMVNDSTYQIASNSTLKLYGSCSSIITGYQAQWQSTGLDSLNEIITSNKVYEVRCKDNNACNTQYRKIYVNTYNGCSLTSNNSAVTGIVLNTNYSGPFVFEIVAPPPVGTITGSYEISDANGIWITGTFNQLRYDSGIGAYHIETNSYVAGSVANPESRNGFIKVKINTQQTYKVNYQYTSFGAYMAGQDANQGYNTVKPQGLSVTYASCIDGKSKVYGNSEAKIQDNNSSYESSKMRIRQLYPTVGNDLTPSFLRKFVYGANYNDDIDGGVIWDLGLVTTGQTYTYRIVGTTGESTGDYSDISFTPTCPNPQISASKSLICYGESSTLTVNGCNGNICWETGQTTATITVKPTFTSTYKAACTTTDGDYSSATFMVKVLNNNAVVSIISNKPSNTILPNENIMLTASGCNNGQVIWVNGFTGTTQIVNPSRITDYFAYCDIGGCRSSISTIKVNVVPPIPTIVSNNSEFCETTATNVILTASGCNGSYYWSTGETSEIIQVPAKTNSYWVVCRIDGIDSEKKHIKLKY